MAQDGARALGGGGGERGVAPEQREGVGLLARGAAGAPGAQALMSRGERRQDRPLQDAEDARVAIEARDRDRREALEDRPLLRMGLELAAVGVKVGQPER